MSRSRLRSVLAAMVVASAVSASPAAAASSCPISYGSADDAKPNKLYLHYPVLAEPSFPEYGGTGFLTSPAQPFDESDLSHAGTATNLVGGINDVVTDDYCEFNVRVIPTQMAPTSAFPRRSWVAIGTDDNTTGRWGRADVVDFGDELDVGHGRVWGGRYQNDGSTAPGGALEGLNNTTQRWANAIGGTAAHEAGHTYGLSHETGLSPGEDTPLGRHIMPAGSDVNSEQRAGYRRHFSDESFSILAGNVGLSIQTMHNWDLVNPNSQTAHRFRLTFLSPQDSPIMSWAYGGSLSPWSAPALASNGTQTFKGTTYNRFRLTWSTDKSWSGGSPGEVVGGGEFHIGATFSGVDFNDPDPIIITNSELLDASGDPLPLKPRLPGYDAGEIDVDDGIMSIELTNFGSLPMEIENVVVRELPRVLAIDSMVPGGVFRDPYGQRFRPLPDETRRVRVRRKRPIRGSKQSISLPVARMSDGPEILDTADNGPCAGADAPAGLSDAAKCGSGFNVSLFPATTLLLTADAVTPDARVFDRRRKRFVRRDLRSRIWYQLGGIHPDLNRNRVDDAVDIEFGQARDRNDDGVPDSAQR